MVAVMIENGETIPWSGHQEGWRGSEATTARNV